MTTLGLITAIADTIHIQSSWPSPVESSSTEPDTPQSSTSVQTCLKPEQIVYHHLYRILSALFDSLYDIYYVYKSAKELWTILEEEYHLDDAGIERFTSSFNKFMVTDNKPIKDQLREF